MLTKEQIAKVGDKEVQEAILAQMEEGVALEASVKAKDVEIATLKNQPVVKNDNDEEIWKGVPPAIRNRFEAIKTERDTMAKAAKNSKDARENDVWIGKSREYKYLQITPEHFGKIMKSVAENSPTDADEIHRVLIAADTLIGKGAIFSEIGKSNGKAGHSFDATNMEARVEALAKDYQQMDPNLTSAQAIAKVFKEHSDWYSPYSKETAVRV
mgnify:CR=1 FL=1